MRVGWLNKDWEIDFGGYMVRLPIERRCAAYLSTSRCDFALMSDCFDVR